MAKRDYYEILNVARNASEAEIRQAYRRLAMKFHPDRNPDDQVAEENFKEAKEAYEVLADSRKRVAYDQFGHAGVEASAGGGYGGAADRFGAVHDQAHNVVSQRARVEPFGGKLPARHGKRRGKRAVVR